MGTLDYIKAAIELARKAQQVELAEQLMSVREEMLELKEENLKLREQVGTLEEAATIRGELQFEKGAYHRVQGDQRDGPYCSRCWDVVGKLVRLMNTREFRAKCPECKTTFDDV